MGIKFYSKKSCTQCRATERAFGKYNLEYEYIDVVEGSPEEAYLKGEGVQQMPYIEAEGFEPWTGFREDLIKQLVA